MALDWLSSIRALILRPPCPHFKADIASRTTTCLLAWHFQQKRTMTNAYNVIPVLPEQSSLQSTTTHGLSMTKKKMIIKGSPTSIALTSANSPSTITPSHDHYRSSLQKITVRKPSLIHAMAHLRSCLIGEQRMIRTTGDHQSSARHQL